MIQLWCDFSSMSKLRLFVTIVIFKNTDLTMLEKISTKKKGKNV